MCKLKLGIDGYISIGNIVNVHFVSSGSIFGAEVLYVPGGRENTWRLKTSLGIIYVQMFERMDLIGSK